MTDSIKALQLNCLHLDQEPRYKVIVDSIAAANPDFGMLQEVNDHQVMTVLLREAGYNHVLVKEFLAKNGDGESVMLFSKTPLIAPEFPAVHHPRKQGRTLAGITEVAGVKVLAITSHSPWGGNNEGSRLRHNEVIDWIADDVAYHEEVDFTILGADLNAEPHYRSIRYLLGHDLASDNESGTLWTDAWNSVGTTENEITISAKNNSLAAGIAHRTGAIDATAVPDRRIDYLMTRGWNYGRRGGFLKLEILAHPDSLELSDHYGLVAEIQI